MSNLELRFFLEQLWQTLIRTVPPFGVRVRPLCEELWAKLRPNWALLDKSANNAVVTSLYSRISSRQIAHYCPRQRLTKRHAGGY